MRHRNIYIYVEALECGSGSFKGRITKDVIYDILLKRDFDAFCLLTLELKQTHSRLEFKKQKLIDIENAYFRIHKKNIYN